MHLSDRIKAKGHKLFFDNYFSTYQIFEVLKARNIFATGTIRIDRFAKPPLISDKDLKKKARGFSDLVTSRDDAVTCVKWYDNKPVVLASNFVGIGKEDTVQRWDKCQKKFLSVKRPEIVRQYNHSMGGVDLLDQLISYYRIYIKSKKWTLRMISHFIDLSLANSWLEYKLDSIKCGQTKSNIMDLLEFRSRIAESLVYVGVTLKRKRGRPANDESLNQSMSPHQEKRPTFEHRPIPEIRSDRTDHFPIHDQKADSTRCKMKLFKYRSNWFCQKCKVHLCLHRERNCFLKFHN